MRREIIRENGKKFVPEALIFNHLRRMIGMQNVNDENRSMYQTKIHK